MPDDFDAVIVAGDYLAARPDLGPAGEVAQAVAARLDLDPGYCREVADHFDRAPLVSAGPVLRRRYELFAKECRAQYEAVRDAGIDVRPWRGRGQPYRDSAELFRRVTADGVLHVHLTDAGHGPVQESGWHPLREQSGVVVDGIPFRHNDLFRAVHDVFGHLVGRNGFGPSGELRAAYCHLPLFPEEVHPVLFAEHVAQTCWFFYGGHLRNGRGWIPGPGEAGHRPPRERPYPPQKVYPFRRDHIDRFRRMFTNRESE